MWYKSEIIRMIEKIENLEFLRMIYTVTKYLHEKME